MVKNQFKFVYTFSSYKFNKLRTIHWNRFLTILFFTFVGNLCSFSQNKEDKTKSGFHWNGNISGGLNFQDNVSMTTNGAMNYFAGANVSIGYKSLNIPLSFTFRERTGSFSHPFSRLGIAPAYKWVKVYLGHNSLNLNPYVLSGIQINGYGAELSPGKFRLAFIKGQVKNTKIIIDSLLNHSGLVNPFQRHVLAAKIGYGTQYNYIDIHMLTGNDKSPLQEYQLESQAYKKEANTTLGLSFGLSFFKKILSLKVNSAASAYTYNQDGSPIAASDLNKSSILRTLNSLVTINQTSGTYLAGDAHLSIKLGNFNISGKYQRIDPLYQSFGIFYLRGDNENYTLNSGLNLFKNKVNISGTWGVNRNNLRNQRNNNTLQKVYNVNLNLNPLPYAGIDLQFSNFSFNQEPTIATIDDSLRLIQINKVNGINPYFNFKGKVYSHNIYLNYNKQTISDITNIVELNNESKINNYSINYTLKNKIKKFSIGTNMYYTNTNYANLTRIRKGLVLSFSKPLIKNNLNTKIKFNYSLNQQDLSEEKQQYNIALQSTYSYQQKSSLSFQFLYGKRPNFRLNNQISDVRISSQINISLN